MRNLVLALAALGVAALGGGAQATVLTFSGSAFIQQSPVPDAYGDRVTATTDAVNGWDYGVGNGFTPNVVLSYPVQETTPFSIWVAGFGDLSFALGHLNMGLGEVVLTPDPGYSVTLHSFDVAPWLEGTPVDSRVRVLDAADNVLFDSGLFDAVVGQNYTFPTGPITSTSALRIINTTNNGTRGFGYLGLDNVSFSQAVPEPSFALVLCALGGLAISARRADRRSEE